MNLHTGSRARAAIALIFALVLASVTTSGAIVSAKDDTAGCVYYETPYKQETSVTDANGETHCASAAEAAAIAEAAGWPDFDPTDMTQEIAQYEAQQEAAAWPDFDPTDMTQEIAQYEAQQEAAAWPDFDPTDMTQEIAQYEAQQEAAANSPRMTQIAAEIASGGGDVDVAYDAPFAAYPGQVIF